MIPSAKHPTRTLVLLGALALMAAACTQPGPEPIHVPAPPPPAVKVFSVTPTRVNPGETVTLTWEVENAQTITIEQLGSGNVPGVANTQLAGEVSLVVQTDSLFLITAYGEGGVDQQSAAVFTHDNVSGLLLSAVPNRILAGERASLVWSALGAEGLTLDDGAGNPIDLGTPAPTSGVIEVTPSVTTRYVLRAGSRSVSTEVQVSAAIQAFTSNNGPHLPGGEVTLNWRTGAATGLSISASGRGTIFTATEGQLNDGSFTDTLPATTPLNSIVEYVLRIDQGSSFKETTLQVFVGVDPQLERFTVPPYAKSSGNVSLDFDWRVKSADMVDLFVNGVHVFRTSSPDQVRQGALRGYAPTLTGQDEIQVMIRATNSLGGKTEQTKTVELVGTPSIEPGDGFYFDASGASQPVQGGTAITLRWNVPHARNLQITDDQGFIVVTESGIDAESGTQLVYPNANHVYTLTADNALGEQVSATFSITVNPIALNLRAHNGVFIEGQPAQLWADAVPAPAPTELYVRTRGYAFERRTPNDFIDISGSGHKLNFIADAANKTANDDGLAEFKTDFRSSLFGHQVNANGGITVSTNGWIKFGYADNSDNDGEFPNTSTTSPQMTFMVSPWWSNLTVKTDGGVYWELVGSGEDQHLVVQWDKMENSFTFGQCDVDFQLQMSRAGDIVFSYRNIVCPMSSSPHAGIQGATASESLSAAHDLGDAPQKISANARLVLGAQKQPLPVTVTAEHPGDYEFFVKRGEAMMPIRYTLPTLVREGDLVVSEAMYQPAARWSAGEWVEIQNRSGKTIDLNGFTLASNDSSVQLESSMGNLMLAPSATLVLAQSGEAAENGELTPDAVYGKQTLSLPDSEGTLTLTKNGAAAASFGYKSSLAGNGGLGRSVQFDYGPFLIGGATTKSSQLCDPTAAMTYGTTAPQRGTPGRVVPCNFYTLSGIEPGFTDIVEMGVGTPLFTGNYTGSVHTPVTLPVPFAYAWQVPAETTSIRVALNGWLSANGSGTGTYTVDDKSPSSSAPNSVIAPFGDDLERRTDDPLSNVYVHRFEAGEDPMAAPGAPGRFVVQWNRLSHVTPSPQDTLTFQVKLVDGGRIEFHYGLMLGEDPRYDYAQGSSANVWIEDLAGSLALPVHTDWYWGHGIAPFTSFAYSNAR